YRTGRRVPKQKGQSPASGLRARLQPIASPVNGATATLNPAIRPDERSHASQINLQSAAAMTTFYRLAADAVVVIHFAYAASVVLGLALILIGIPLRWRWIRNRWFRLVHLAMIGTVVAEAWAGIVCPLTV